MSVLATDKKLISFGTDYSAGSGISIIDHTISVTGEFGKTYSAGPNIGIYDVSGQPTISSKDWSSYIANASANAYEQAVSQIPEPQDLSYISATVDKNTSGIDYISSVCLTSHKDWTDTIKNASANSYTQSTSYFNDWINGQYAGDITNITNNLTSLSGDLSSYYKKTETSSKEQISDALQYVSANAGKVYEGVSPIVVNNTQDKISADTWNLSAGDGISFVDDNVNKITRIDVTAQGGDEEVNSIVHSNSGTWNSVTGKQDSLTFGHCTASGSISSINGSAIIDDYTYNMLRVTRVATANLNRAITANSGTWNTVTNKLDTTAFSQVSGDFLTTSFSIPESAVWNETSNVVQTNSAQWAEGGSTFDPTYMSAQIDNKLNKSEIGFRKVNSIDYVSGISGKNISAKFAYRANTAYNADHATTASYDDNGNSLTTTYYNAQEANNKVNDLFNFVQSNSANWEGGSSPSVDNKVLFYKNYSYDPSNGSQNKDTFVSGATELYFEAAVDSQQSIPSEIVLYRNGNEIGRAYWSQVSSDGSYNYLTASYNNADGGDIQIPNYNGTNYSNFVVSANGVKTLFFYQDSFDCATDKEVKFNIIGSNIVGQINGWLQGNITPLTSFTGGLTDFTAKGYNKYDTNITYEDSNNSYNYLVSAEFGGTLTGEFVPQSAFDELKQSYDALSSLFATYSGQWLLPNEGV